MKTLFLFISILFLISPSFSQRPAQGPMSKEHFTPKKLGYQLIWEDDFKGDRLDTTKWKVRGVGPRALTYVTEEAVKVEDGYLKLYALKKDDKMLGSAVGTQDRFMAKIWLF